MIEMAFEIPALLAEEIQSGKRQNYIKILSFYTLIQYT